MEHYKISKLSNDQTRSKLKTKKWIEVNDFFYLQSDFLSLAYLTVANLARFGISVHCQVSVRSQYLSGSCPSAGLQMVTQSTHLSKDCYPQLVSNPNRSEIRLPM